MLGPNVGLFEGEYDGLSLDWNDGRVEGVDVGWEDEGNGDGLLVVGFELGLKVGFFDGSCVGSGDGEGEGLFEGERVNVFAVGW